MLRVIRKLLMPEVKRELGRWALKHESKSCDLFMYHLHADPGYVNPFKKVIKEPIKKDIIVN
tara:strand:+ start:1018 stop:1203 length:186 start_codon:yes stop_codon:yes gene_type:complete